MKDGFFTEWIPRWDENDKRYHEKAPELNGKKLTGKYAIPEISKSSDERILVDVGAAQGYFSMSNYERFDKIYCFEPCYPNFRKLSSNILENPNFSKKMSFFNYAVGKPEDSGNLIDFTFNSADSPYGGNLYRQIPHKKKSQASHRVPVLCLNDIFLLIDEKKIDVLKCDTEGAEYDFLMDQDLSSIDILILETHQCLIDQNMIKNLCNHIISQGFSENLVSPDEKPKWSKKFKEVATSKGTREFTLYNTNNVKSIKKKWEI